MKKKFRNIYLGAMALAIGMAGCSHRGTAEEITVYGQVTKIAGEHITIALIEKGSQNGKGPDQLVLTGEEQVVAVSDETKVEDAQTDGRQDAALDDIEPGSIVTVVLDDGIVRTISVEPEADIARKTEDTAGDKDKTAMGSIEPTGILLVDGKSENSDGETIASSKGNESAVLVKNGGRLSMTRGKLTKAGDTMSVDESNSFGVNAAFTTMAGSESSINDSEITSASEGANAIFAAGEGALVHADDVDISTSGDYSAGLSASFGGEVVAEELDITTSGERSASITAKEGGTVKVSGGTVSTTGNNSPCILASGTISMDNVIGNAKTSRALVVEGNHTVTLNKCDLSGTGDNGIMFYQGKSQLSEKEIARLDVADSKITLSGEGTMFYIYGIQAKANLENTELVSLGKALIRVAGNDTANQDASGIKGGDFTLTGVNQKLAGDITCDGLSSVSVALTGKSTLKGAVNSENKGKNVEISLDMGTDWELTADSYVNVIKNEDAQCTNIKANGFTVYYDKANTANRWLGGKTITLSGGGKLAPR